MHLKSSSTGYYFAASCIANLTTASVSRYDSISWPVHIGVPSFIYSPVKIVSLPTVVKILVLLLYLTSGALREKQSSK